MRPETAGPKQPPRSSVGLVRHTSDALVIGSGLAALSYALELGHRGYDVLVVTKGRTADANTTYAQGGIAAVIGMDDSFEDHIEDTLRAGAGLCRPDIVSETVRAAPQVIARLTDAGVAFDRKTPPGGAGEASPEPNLSGYDLAREGGHGFRRVLHAGDMTGQEIMRALVESVRALPNVRVLEHDCAIDLLTTRKVEGLRTGAYHRAPQETNRCLGAYVLHEQSGEVHTLLAPVTLIATGGASKVYLYTSNPDVATGDGVAMAWRAGADIANMEFIQFHPTCLYHPKAKSFLISEALRGEGGILRRLDGTRFMGDYDTMLELAPRDIVARAIDRELKRTGDDHVLLDVTHLDGSFLTSRFPNIHKRCLEFGVDFTQEPIPVVPAAHYVCGGIRTDAHGETNIRGLFAAGEAACTGMHGANRLASNSLLEAAVFGYRAALASEPYLRSEKPRFDDVPDWNPGDAVPSDELVVITQCWDEIRRFMWNYVGIVRTDRRLLRAQRRIETIKEEIREFYWNATLTKDLIELRNICTVAELIVTCALRRKESRGLHYTLNHPDLADNEPPCDTLIRRRDLIA